MSSHISQRRLPLFCTLAALLIGATGLLRPVDARADDPSSSDYYVAVSGVDLDPATDYSIQAIDQLATSDGGQVIPGDGAPSSVAVDPQDSEAPAPDPASSSNAPSAQPASKTTRTAKAKAASTRVDDTGDTAATAQPDSVASGYVLFNPGRVNGYTYDSDWGTIQEVHCDSDGCDLESKWETQVHMYLNGGSSKSWVITLNARHESGYSSVSFDYHYYCSINVSGGDDHYCSTGHGADPSDSGAMNPGDKIHKYFEINNYSNVEYAMIGIGVQFHHSQQTNKDRLADVCTTASGSSICKKSGNGTGGTHTW